MDIFAVEKRCIEIAASSPCAKRKVGAVLVAKVETGPLGRVTFKEIAAGTNYNPTDGVCENIDGETLPSVIHAEIACLTNYKQLEKSPPVQDLIMYVTHPPCGNCQYELDAYGIECKVVKSFMKFSHAKPRMALVPASLAQGCARALTYGARKYKVNNWRKTPDIEEYISALQRHLDAWREGEDNDVESGLNHLDHMAANLAFITELKHLPKIKE